MRKCLNRHIDVHANVEFESVFIYLLWFSSIYGAKIGQAQNINFKNCKLEIEGSDLL